MQVETYLVDEVDQQSADECEGALALVNKLGLAGQKKLFTGDTPKQSPFRKFTHEEWLGLRALCPKTTEITQYSSGAIPLRVLEVAEKAIESRLFDKVVIWHPEDVRKDPVLVGVQFYVAHTGAKTDCDSLNNDFILARWGEALDEIPALFRKARETIRASMLDLRQQIDADLARIDSVPANKIRTSGVGSVGYYTSPIT